MFINAFPTPIFHGDVQIPEQILNNALKELKEGDNEYRNANYKHTKRINIVECGKYKNTLPNSVACVEYMEKTFKGFLNTLFPEATKHLNIESNAWSMEYNDGTELSMHSHRLAHWCGVLFLTNSPNVLRLANPAVHTLNFYPKSILSKLNERVDIPTEKGKMVIFPGYLLHYIKRSDPHFRLVIACDFHLTDKVKNPW